MQTRIGRAIAEVRRAAARGELTAEQAAALVAALHERQQHAVWRAALDTAATDPVRVRLIGQRPAVANVLTALDAVTALTDVSDPIPARAGFGLVHVYATAERRHPLTGGIR
ncbi:hypothetical protein [Catellatospora citrea]|uniref:Uncharacterized protein n=1 Tax=Catellatospora citrea TaxID=53366 RepID=A0A8J3KNB5_9ACTN|nr:hypothetical protein [Catellatospora citrea]RKE09695.1 hypothetical protein C8E86_4585 [Catellatospora citrea]GIG03268.1 hypothetical protein Cci01nite_83610 [Catellatospora citrea]